MAATLTANTFLMHGTGSGTTTYTKLVDIKEYPDLGKAPDTVETTTLSDTMKTYINDLMDAGSLEFNANYEKTAYQACADLAGKQEKYAIYMGVDSTGKPDGNLGKFTFTGELAVWAKGGSTGAVREMGIAIAPSTEIEFA